MGLLGAEHFARQPTIPLDSIAAAVNLDTVAIHPRGEAVAILGRGLAPLDTLIEETARGLGRRIDQDREVDVMIRRQDGWAFARNNVPTVMVGGSISNMERLQAFLASSYHKPDDQPGGAIELGGAAEDADLLVALARRLADPAVYQPPQR
jgi:Zn-dependent M28 family amino/carboxypeptidase